MLTFCLFALYSINAAVSNVDNLNQYRNYHQYDEYGVGDQKQSPPSSPKRLTKDYWKLKASHTPTAEHFVTDMITETRKVLRHRLEAKRDQFMTHMQWPITDGVKARMYGITENYLIPKIDQIFTKAMVWGFNDIKLTYAEESNVDVNKVKAYNYDTLQHPITAPNIFYKLPIYHNMGAVSQPVMSPIIPIQTSPHLNRMQKATYRYALHIARVDFEESLHEKQEKLKETVHEKMVPVYKMNQFLPQSIAGSVEKSVKSFEKYTVDTMGKEARWCFGLVEEAFMSKLEGEKNKKAHVQYDNRLYNEIYRKNRNKYKIIYH